MNIFDIFHKVEYDNINVFLKNFSKVTLGELKKDVANASLFLKGQNNDKAVIISENFYDFTVWFLASVYTGKEIFLVTDSSKLNYLDFNYVLLNKLNFNENNVLEYSFLPCDKHNVFVNFFTSGSTAKPKMIKKTLANLISEAIDVTNEFRELLKTVSKIESSTKPQHMFAMTFRFMLPLCNLGKFLMVSEDVCYPDNVDLSNALFVSTPSFLELYKKFDLRCDAGVVVTAGAKLPQKVFEYLEQQTNVLEVYGSTESGVIGWKRSSKKNCLTTFSNVSVSVNKESQIVINSQYFIEENLTLCDIIKMQDDKHFNLINRADRVFKIQDKRISAPELEACLLENKLVQDVYCFQYGDKMACTLVLSDIGKNWLLDNIKDIGVVGLYSEIKNFLKDKVEIVPQKWKILYEIPKNMFGKIDKAKLAKIFGTNLSMPIVLSCQKNINEACYELIFPKNSNFFEGHFNNFPILPGVVQLYYANYFAKDAFGCDISTEVVKKIKFSKIIKPDEKVCLHFSNIGKNINYTYIKDDMLCSTGVMTINE